MTAIFGRLGSFFLDIIQTVVLAIAIFLIAYLFLFQPHQVQGHSMDPNFADGEYLLTDKLSYRFGKPERGDVIVFAAPPSKRDDYIKRIVGLPGESVMISNNKILINKDVLDEKYIPEDFVTRPGAYLGPDTPITLKENEYFVVGDNRDHSSDSRSWGPINRKDIVGKAWFVYWPPSEVGKIPGVSY